MNRKNAKSLMEESPEKRKTDRLCGCRTRKTVAKIAIGFTTLQRDIEINFQSQVWTDSCSLLRESL